MVSSGKFLAIIFLFVLLVGIIFLLFGAKFPLTKDLHEKIFGVKAAQVVNTVSGLNTVANKDVVIPPDTEDWCKIQEVIVPIDREKYSRDQIIGWDNIEQCCIRKLSGYNCALHRDGNVQYCYTAHVGGEVKWASVDGYFVEASKYQAFINDLAKENIINRPCYDEKYPTLLRGVENE